MNEREGDKEKRDEIECVRNVHSKDTMQSFIDYSERKNKLVISHWSKNIATNMEEIWKKQKTAKQKQNKCIKSENKIT